MNKNNILTADVLDILFDGRNKDYGAYDLRKTYNNRITKALLGIGLLCLLLSVGTIWANEKKVKTIAPTVIDISLESHKLPDEAKVEIPKEQPKPQAAKAVQTIVFNIPVIEEDDKVRPDDMVKPVEDLDAMKIGPANIDGDKGLDNIVAAPVEKGTGNSNGNEIAAKKGNEDYDGIFGSVQIEAEFPGGKEGWKKYLEKNLNSGLPADNGANNGKYSVTVSFVVDKEGNISDVKAENDPGFGTAEEALRIIKKGPRWKPAQQNGRFVAYRARQQVTFMVNEG